MRTILLIMIGLSSLVYADFSRSTAGVVTDSVTHLEWQDDYSDHGGYAYYTDWTSAIGYCEALGLDSGGWRLPNIKELLSIVDYGESDPAMNSVFQNTNPYYPYWSSTFSAVNNDTVVLVDFDDGHTAIHYMQIDSNYVRCVRAGQ